MAINLNLDTVPDRRFEPYVFSSGDRSFTFTDPSVLDWQIVETIRTVSDLAELCMSEEDKRDFYALPLAGYKLEILFEDVQRHFQLGRFKRTR